MVCFGAPRSVLGRKSASEVATGGALASVAEAGALDAEGGALSAGATSALDWADEALAEPAVPDERVDVSHAAPAKTKHTQHEVKRTNERWEMADGFKLVLLA